jgi:dephospho-CoA kinase
MPTSPKPKPSPTASSLPPLAVAITGGIGAGKSEALKAFARHGAATVSSDDIVHRLLREDAAVKQAIVDRFGAGVLGPDGEIVRSAVAQIVFRDRDELLWLEALLHPRVSQEYLEWREELSRLPDPPAVCATEVPLLYESGGETRFDAVVVVTAPRQLREARTHVTLDDRGSRLLPDRDKVKRADYVYVNTGSLEKLDAWVEEVVRALAART